MAVLLGAGAATSLIFINHAPLIPLIMADLDISPTQAGLLSTAMFLGGGLAAFPVGRLTDRLGAKQVMSLAMLLLAASTVALAAAPDYETMLAIRLLSGAGVTASFIAGGAYVNEVWPGPSQYLAQGFFGASMQLGLGAAIFALPAVAVVAGWRPALAACALPLVVAWLAWEATAVPGRRGAERRPWGFVLRDPTVWRLALANAAMFGLSVVLGTWVAVYFVHEFGASLTRAGVLGSLSILLGVAARPLGGVLVARGHSDPRRLILVALAGNAAALLLLAWPGRSLAAAVLGVVLFGMTSSVAYPAVISLVGRAQPTAAGAALGLVGTTSMASIVVGAPLAGALFAWAGHFTVPFVVLALLPVAAFVVCRRLAPD
jgi:nitrate/nitrite transporter NarK